MYAYIPAEGIDRTLTLETPFNTIGQSDLRFYLSRLKLTV